MMLQASMQEESGKVAQRSSSIRELDDAQTDSSQAYQSVAASCKTIDDTSCTSKAMRDRDAEIDVLAERERRAAEEDKTAAVTSKSMAKVQLDDPPGAGTLKAVLLLMTVLIFVDGIRRWRLQKQEAREAAQVRTKAAEAAAEHEAAVERTWVEMVTAAAAGDVSGFRQAAQVRPGPPVKREDPWGCTPLHFAATGGSTEVVADLLKCGAEVDALDACDETALHFAARAGHKGVCEVLLGSRANIDAMNVRDMTPLIVAGHANKEPVCRFLADKGATVGGMADEDLPPLVVSQIVRKVLGSA
jgi:hypothetical protein